MFEAFMIYSISSLPGRVELSSLIHGVWKPIPVSYTHLNYTTGETAVRDTHLPDQQKESGNNRSRIVVNKPVTDCSVTILYISAYIRVL